MWCHLFSLDLDELHAFAMRLGVQRAWFQRPPKASWPHYDITAAKRVSAVRLGAVEAESVDVMEVAYHHTGWTPERLARISKIRARMAMRKFDEECGLHE